MKSRFLSRTYFTTEPTFIHLSAIKNGVYYFYTPLLILKLFFHMSHSYRKMKVYGIQILFSVGLNFLGVGAGVLDLFIQLYQDIFDT